LNTLYLQYLVGPAVLAAIGKKLVNLDLWKPSKEVDAYAGLSRCKGLEDFSNLSPRRSNCTRNYRKEVGQPGFVEAE
jgi:hypothetical protein